MGILAAGTERTSVRVRRIIKIASEECICIRAAPGARAKRRGGGSTGEKLATVFVISVPAEIIDNRTSITIQRIEEPAR